MFISVVAVVTLGSGLGALVALVAAILHRWRLAKGAARVSALVAGAVFVVFVATLVLLFVAPSAIVALISRTPSDGEPGGRARVLAETVSELINCAALSLPAAALAAVIWFLAARRVREAREPRPDGSAS